MAAGQEDVFSDAFAQVCRVFRIPYLKEPQKTAIAHLLRGSDVFLSVPTGYGKSVVYCCLPLVVSHLRSKGSFPDLRLPESPVALVVSPLLSLMEDQVSLLTSLGVSAAMLGGSSDSCIEKGQISVVFGSPERWLGSDRWRSCLESKDFTRSIVAVCVDEAHTVVQCVGEIRSTVRAPMLAVTATASSSTRRFLLKHLGMAGCIDISLNPDRSNIRLSLIRVSNDIPENFQHMIQLLSMTREKTTRIIVCTSAMGMGVNMKGVNVILHYGPPSTIEEYMQEIGRGGRNGGSSHAVLLYNKRLTRHCKKEMKSYISNQCICRREGLLQHFGHKKEPSLFPLPHACCDICTTECDCGTCPVDYSDTVPFGLGGKNQDLGNCDDESTTESDDSLSGDDETS
ncbi:ATP-dependent DNA helicase RecQ-like [Oscarella lobularis]|uniref:ATP-dependent DNA helicase RecQ-like n=1 Tax=Oscarella lobularis TaxID=121494 RepID=UPI003313F2DE